MTWDSAVPVLLAAGVLLVLGWGLTVRGPGRWTPVAAAASMSLAGGVVWLQFVGKPVETAAAHRGSLPREGRPGGFVSSGACQACHPGQYASWYRTYHRTMTQPATASTVMGRFDHIELTQRGMTWRLDHEGDEFWIEGPDLDDPAFQRGGAKQIRKRVGMLTGSHHMQVYWLPARPGNLQRAFPFAYLIREQRWVPREDVFLRDPSTPHPLQTWNMNCIHCHTTAGQPFADPQTHTVDSRMAEFGIACEACHGAGERHVAANRNPIRRYLQHLGNTPDTTIVHPARETPDTASQICGRCHGVKWIPDRHAWQQEGFRYQPGGDLQKEYPLIRPAQLTNQPWLQPYFQRNPAMFQGQFWSDGKIRVSGREYNGLLESPCHQRGALSCLSCHSLHHGTRESQVAPNREGNQACLQCHQPMAKQVAAHTHHLPGSAGSLCYNCHMPYTTYGLLKAIRSHTIDSPSVASTLQTGRPNACNQCHVDKSLEWTARKLADWYGHAVPPMGDDRKRVSATAYDLLCGDPGQRALAVWSLGWESARQASGSAWMAPLLAEGLDDPYAAVRYIAGQSLRRLSGFGGLSYDYTAPVSDRKAAQQSARELWRRLRPSAGVRANPATLILPSLDLDAGTLSTLLRKRSSASLELEE